MNKIINAMFDASVLVLLAIAVHFLVFGLVL